MTNAFSSEIIKAAVANSTANVTIADVVGNKTDTNIMGPGNNSLYQLAGYMGYYHVHSPAQCYPVLANPVTVTAAATAWTGFGAWVEVVPASTITDPFDIHWVHTGEISAQGNYVLELGSGGAGAETTIAQIAFSRDSNQVQTASQPIQIAPVAANTRIAARLASNNAVADTVDVKIYYHVYP
jgi:hypothetical protein